MISRYSSRIGDACYYINKKISHPEKTNRRIFVISNGLDPKLNYGDQWNSLLYNEKDKYCFFFIEPNFKDEDKREIGEIWKNFSKETQYEVVNIDDPYDIIEGEENIYTKFAHSLSNKIVLTEVEEKKMKKNLNNIEGRFYQPKYEEKYNIIKIK